MHKHHGNHSNPTHHANILMYGHKGTHKALGGPMMSNSSQYKKGGKAHRRRHHDEGGSTGVNPVTGMKTPSLGDNIMEKRRGGRACHAEGDTIKPLRRGGKAHRKHHDDGGGIEGMHAMHNLYGPWPGKAEGGKTEPLKRGGKAHRKHRSLGGELGGVNFNDLAQKLTNAPRGGFRWGPLEAAKRGGNIHKRRCHAKGEEVETMHMGGKKKSMI
jgi:hypothetical protein